MHACIPIFEETYSRLIHWPSLDEWQDLQGGWGKLPFAVGAIDGTSTEIYRPITEPQEQYYSGHRQYMLMRNIGQQLPFPDELFLLGDKIYQNRHPVLTAYTRQQIIRKPRNMQRKCRKLNRLITHYRVKVEHAIGELKKYKVMGTLWRHPRQRLTSVVTICAAFVCRRKDFILLLALVCIEPLNNHYYNKQS
ncbi:unnamed protein product [Mytilus edulis]|uniref:DDE Tnp4 domain-containing protein n=1 Tax=Mytilus edulis TaxID=6550 RepID=A0A8S3RQF9_MYTED|nr:unnamed protein product [Mytilus edulis]